MRRQHLYRQLRESMPVLTAEAVYRQFRRERAGLYDCAALSRVFHVDDHALWPEESDDEQGASVAARRRADPDRDGNRILQPVRPAARPCASSSRVPARGTADYRSFLRRFAALREEVAVDADSFDYGYYAYGLRHFGNMPLIEPLETREVRRIEDFVIAIDTSMSTSGELVRGFLSHTYALLRENESFFPTLQPAHPAVRRPTPRGQAHHLRARAAGVYGAF